MPRSESLTGSESGADAADQHPCGLCGEPVKTTEEYISGTCSACGEGSYHLDCVIEMLQDMAKQEKANKWSDARKVYAVRRPAHQLELQTPRCPVGCWKPPPERLNCPGRIVAAESIKPQRAAGPPATPAAASTRNKQKVPVVAPALPRGSKPWAPHATGGAMHRSASSSGRGTRHHHQQQPYELPTRDRLGVRLPGIASGQEEEKRKGPSRSASLHFGPRGRPDRLKLCSNWRDCRALNCVFAHDKVELAAREVEWVEEEEKRLKHEERKREMEEAQRRAALRVRAEEAREAAANLSILVIASMQEYKMFYCSASLMEMGFDPGSAEQASLATGGELEAAANLLAAGGLSGAPPKPIDVSREAEELVGVALLLGLPLAALESQLLSCRGNWEAAEEGLKEQAQQAGQSAGLGGILPGDLAWADTPPADSGGFPSAGGSEASAGAAGEWGYVGEASGDGDSGSAWEPVYSCEQHSQLDFWPATPVVAGYAYSTPSSEAAAAPHAPLPVPAAASTAPVAAAASSLHAAVWMPSGVAGTYSAGYQAGMATAVQAVQMQHGADEAAGGTDSIDWGALLGGVSAAGGAAVAEGPAIDAGSGWGNAVKHASKGLSQGYSHSKQQEQDPPDAELSDMLALLGVG